MYVKIIQTMHDKARTSVKIVREGTGEYTVKVGVHQGPALRPYLFALIADELTKSVQEKHIGVRYSQIRWF